MVPSPHRRPHHDDQHQGDLIMTITETIRFDRLRTVSFDLYRDIHKGIRSELFALVSDAGRLDPADDCGAASLVDEVQGVVRLLVQHAEHEDGAIQPVLEQHAPSMAMQVADDHHRIEGQMDGLVALAIEARETPSRRAVLHELYLDLAAFTSEYLAHQDLEEREVGQALDSILGFDGMLAVHASIIANIPPHELGASLAIMFPAMNVDDRTELLGGMKASAPAEAFESVWSLAASVLSPHDHRAIAMRLGL
jgi:hypothetical protein